MKIVFLSNYFNHHQAFLSNEFNKICEEYRFVETEEMGIERKKLGYHNDKKPDFVINSKDYSREYLLNLINNADVVITGSAPEYLVEERKKQGKLIFRYSERLFRKSFEPIKCLVRYYLYNKKNPKNSNIYMLCASAYTASDYAKFGLFKNKCYKWGYFPECKNYDIDKLIFEKSKNSILWCARLIDLKHPEIAILIAEKLKALNVPFKMNIIGIGVLENDLKSKIKEKKLEDCVKLLGSMSPEEVRKNMEKSQVFLMTSDRQEGWGAVVNESMNSACAIIANEAVGSVPYLVKDSVNGYTYSKCDIDEICNKIIELFNNEELRRNIQKNAYATISNEWNASVAAERLIKLSNAILSGEKSPNLFDDGVCSKDK